MYFRHSIALVELGTTLPPVKAKLDFDWMTTCFSQGSGLAHFITQDTTVDHHRAPFMDKLAVLIEFTGKRWTIQQQNSVGNGQWDVVYCAPPDEGARRTNAVF